MLLGKGQGSEKLSTRSDLERVVLTLANKTKSKELKTLPYTSSLRGQVIQSRINNLRGAEQDRKHAKNNGLSVDRNFKRFPTMPMTLKPEEKAGFIAVDTYAKARHEIEKASLWMAEGTRKAPELFENLRKAANKVVEQGTHAEKHFSRFKIDRRMLYGDTFAGKNAESKKILPFVQKKSFKIQRAITMLLRLAGVPIPRLPMPRLPRPRAPLSRGVGRELRKP